MTELLKTNGIAKINPNLVGELSVVYMEYAEDRRFPDGFCTTVSRDIAERYKLRYREGTFKLDRPNRSGTLTPTHAWCEDADKIRIDLTLHQFIPYLNPGTRIFTGDSHIIRPKDPLYDRYSPLEK